MKKLAFLIVLLLLGTSGAVAQSSVAPPNGLSETQAYSIFLQSYQNEQYDKALKFGSWIWQGMPRTLEGYAGFDLEKNLGRITESYGGLAKAASSPSDQEAYADSALMIFDRVFSNFDEEEISYYDWHVRKGRFIRSNSDYIENFEELEAEEYKKAMAIDEEKLMKSADGYYLQVILRDMVAKDQKDEALALMNTAENYDVGLDDAFDQIRDKLFDTPEERIGFLKDQLAEDPENTTLLRELRGIYEDEDMTEEVLSINETLYEIEPNYENTRALADVAVSNDNYEDAVTYLTEALEKAPDERTKFNVAMELSRVHQNHDNLQEARKFARQAMELNSESGDPYMRIAGIYAQAVRDCTSSRTMEREDRAVYWLVIDYLQQAKNVDSSVSRRADSQIGNYTEVAPTVSDVHFKTEWDQGASLQIDGSLNSCYSWINESTTIPNF